MRQHSRTAVYAGVIGIAGWLLLVLATLIPDLAPPQPAAPGPATLLVALIVIVSVRAMAFELYEGAMVSLDAPLYVAAAVTMGSVRAAWLVATGLALDALARALRRAHDARRRERLPLVPYLSGLTAALLLLVAWIFGVDRLASRGTLPARTAIWVVPAMGVSLLLAHYLVQGMRMRLAGFRPRDVARRMALPGIVAEATLLPLAVVMVIVHDPEAPAATLLLGATYVLVNFMFNRVYLAGAILRQRVHELEILNRLGHAIGAALEQHPIVLRVSRETMAAIPEATGFALGLREGPDRGVLFRLDRDAERLEQGELQLEGPGARVLETGASTIEDSADAGARPASRAAVPLSLYGDTLGFLEVKSARPDAFGPDEMRLLEAIAGQTSVALENARLYELATIDGLTGLYVRRYFDGRVQDEWQRGRRFGTSFAVMLLDLDDFKEINDRHGHAAGDRLLREIASVVKQSLRGIDIAARHGGDEFGVVLPRTTLADARGVAERVRADVERHGFVWDGTAHRVTSSIGVAACADPAVTDPQHVVRQADEALYRAKAAGKNRVALADSEEPSKVLPLRAGR